MSKEPPYQLMFFEDMLVIKGHHLPVSDLEHIVPLAASKGFKWIDCNLTAQMNEEMGFVNDGSSEHIIMVITGDATEDDTEPE